MEFSNKSIFLVFGLKRELEIFGPSKKFSSLFGFGKKSSLLLKRFITKDTKVIINLGFCGSIDKKVKCGEIYEAEFIFNEEKEKIKPIKYNHIELEKKIQNLCLRKANLMTTNSVKNLSEKIKLRKKNTNISLIDMEAFHILKALGNEKISFYSIKIVYDDLFFEIPEYIASNLDKDGSLLIDWTFIRNLVVKPKRIFELIRLSLSFNFCRKKFKKLIDNLFYQET